MTFLLGKLYRTAEALSTYLAVSECLFWGISFLVPSIIALSIFPGWNLGGLRSRIFSKHSLPPVQCFGHSWCSVSGQLPEVLWLLGRARACIPRGRGLLEEAR